MEDLMRQLLVDTSFKNHIFPLIKLGSDAAACINNTDLGTMSDATSEDVIGGGGGSGGGQQPKPQHSYIGLIAMAILSSAQRKMVLSEVYEWIMTEYPYFRSRGAGWRNSIRHNLSLNDCFVKAGRAANGKGHYWAVHPACVRDFERGDFRRRRAQRKVRRHMGLSVEEGDSSDDESFDPASSIGSIYSIFGSSVAGESIERGVYRRHSEDGTHRIKSFTIDAILEHC